MGVAVGLVVVEEALWLALAERRAGDRRSLCGCHRASMCAWCLGAAAAGCAIGHVGDARELVFVREVV